MLTVIISFAIVLILCYFLQLVLAFINAQKTTDSEPSILSRLFIGSQNITGTWITIGIILVIPVLISWISGIVDNFLELDPNFALYSACMSTLLVLVTLELSVLNGLTEHNREPWRGLLHFALGLDLLSITLLVGPIKIYVNDPSSGGWANVINYVFLTGVAALISSLFVILFARKAGERT